MLKILLGICCCLPLWGDLTLEEKIGQMLVVHFYGAEANDDARDLINQAKVGGVVYYVWSNSLTTPKQIKRLSEGLQQLTQENRNPIPLFIALDEEGGRVSRLPSGFTKSPSNYVIGKEETPEYAKNSAQRRGKEMRAVGINVNFAPVVDIACNPHHHLMKNRCFGKTPETVIAFGKKALEGYKEAGMIATLKHYPGHGDVNVDSHFALPIINKSLEELEQGELLPFKELSPHAEMIMTGHLFVPALDSEKCATLSKKILGYLKNHIGFQGIVISDSFAMKAVFQGGTSVDEVVIEAIKAGCDLLLLGGKAGTFELSVQDVLRIHARLVQAVNEKEISEDQINCSVEKILQLKSRFLH